MKKHLTRQEEFEIMKLVIDKFLWLGVGIMAYGFYKMITANTDIWYGLTVLLSGAVVLVLFMMVVLKEYNYAKK